jgi:hypothetical protein
MEFLTLLSPEEQSAQEKKLLSKLQLLASTIVDENQQPPLDDENDCVENDTGTLVDDEHVQDVLDSLQSVIVFCSTTPSAFLSCEQQLLMFVLPTLQTYGQLTATCELTGNAKAIEVSGICCSIFSVLVERSLQALPTETPVVSSDALTPVISPSTPTAFFDMHRHWTDLDEAQQCFYHHFHLLSELGEMGWCEVLLEVLLMHIEDETLTELVVYSLFLLLKHGPTNNHVLFMQANGAEAIAEAFTLHSDNIPLIMNCFDVITLLAETSDEIREQLGGCGVCEAITEALRYALSHCNLLVSDEIEENNSTTHKQGDFGVPEHGSYQPPNVDQVVSPSTSVGSFNSILSKSKRPNQVDGAPLFQQLDRQEPAESVARNDQTVVDIAVFVAKACWLMGRLCDNCSENQRLFGESDACDVILDVLRAYYQEWDKAIAQNIDSETDQLSAFPNSANNIQSINPELIQNNNPFSIVISWCCFAISELSNSHDENQWKFGNNQSCLLLVDVLHVHGSCDSNICILACQALSHLIEMNETNKNVTAIEGRLGEELINLIHCHMSHSETVLWTCNLLSILLRSGLNDRIELSVGRMIGDCDGGIVLAHVLINHIGREAICMKALPALASLLSVLQQDNNEVNMEEIMHTGVMAVVKEVIYRYPQNEELLEFGEMILDKLIEANVNLVI